GNEGINPGQDLQNEFECPSLAILSSLVACYWSDDSDECAVCSVHSNGIGNEKILGPIFTRHGTAVCLIPIEDNLGVHSLGNEVTVYSQWLTCRVRDLNSNRLQRFPPRAG